MKIHCSLSGIAYSTDCFAISLEAGHSYHPVFDVPASTLPDLYTSYLNQALSPVESYLVFCAMLKNTQLVQWRAPISYNESKSASIIANHIQALFTISSKLSALQHPQFVAPKVIISSENNDLANVKYWILLWEEAYLDFIDGLAESQYYDALKKKESVLAKFLKSPQIPPERYANVLADWAALAAGFPENYSAYWKELIIKCHNADNIIKIPELHIRDLIEYCEENIDEYATGSIFSHALFTALSTGLDVVTDFYNLSGAHGFTQIDGHSPEQLLILEQIKAAPVAEPERHQYPNAFAFIKAKMAYQLAQRYALDTATTQVIKSDVHFGV